MGWFKTKFYKEVKCMSCDGTGKTKAAKHIECDRVFNQAGMDAVLFLSQGICSACKGRGTQTVLECEK